MTAVAHLSAGIVVYKLTKISSVDLPNGLIVASSILGAFVPDIDGLFGNKMNNHRYTMFHSPLFWLLLVLFAVFAGIIFHLNFLIFGSAVFGLGVVSHIVLDIISARTCGIMLFYPISRKIYSLFPLNPKMGDIPVLPDKSHIKFWKFYLENKLLVGIEVLVILFGMIFPFL